jgi:DUF971 family protein
MNRPFPVNVRLRTVSRVLDISFDDGERFELPFEYLRVFSPSAEVRGHGGGEPLLVTGKEAVNIIEADPAGNYAVKLRFDDGHDTGLYSWPFLHELGRDHAKNWARYLQRCAEAGYRRAGSDSRS